MEMVRLVPWGSLCHQVAASPAGSSHRSGYYSSARRLRRPPRAGDRSRSTSPVRTRSTRRACRTRAIQTAAEPQSCASTLGKAECAGRSKLRGWTRSRLRTSTPPQRVARTRRGPPHPILWRLHRRHPRAGQGAHPGPRLLLRERAQRLLPGRSPSSPAGFLTHPLWRHLQPGPHPTSLVKSRCGLSPVRRIASWPAAVRVFLCESPARSPAPAGPSALSGTRCRPRASHPGDASGVAAGPSGSPRLRPHPDRCVKEGGDGVEVSGSAR